MTERGDIRKLTRAHLDDRGEASIEYMLLIITVVLPIAATVPLLFQMILSYFYRIVAVVAMPFP